MAMTPYSGETEIIGKLGTTPQERGLTTQQFKDKFDEGLQGFVGWFNDIHKAEFDALAAIESGSWTPTIAGSTTAGSNTYTTQSGYYYKIGDLVYLTGYIKMSTKDAAMSGNARIAGLPFSVRANTYPAIAFAQINNIDYSDGSKQLIGAGFSNVIGLYTTVDNGAQSPVTTNHIQATTEVQFNMVYIAA